MQFGTAAAGVHACIHARQSATHHPKTQISMQAAHVQSWTRACRHASAQDVQKRSGALIIVMRMYSQYACLFAHMHGCRPACVNACVRVCIRAGHFACTQRPLPVSTYICIHTWTRFGARAYVHELTRACEQTSMQNMRAEMRADSCTYAHALAYRDMRCMH